MFVFIEQLTERMEERETHRKVIQFINKSCGIQRFISIVTKAFYWILS